MNLKDLLEYQKVDNELFTLEMQVKTSKEAKEIANYSEIKKKSMDDYHKNLRDIEDALTHIEKYNKAYAKTNAEIDELIDVLGDFQELKEIDKYEKLIAQQQKDLMSIEKELYKLNNMIDECEKICKQSITNFAKCNKLIAERKAVVDNLMASMKDKVAEIKGRMKELASKIPADVLIKYNNARKSNRLPIVVPLNGSNCSGCGMDLPSSETAAIKENTIIDCPNCGRLIYKN